MTPKEKAKELVEKYNELLGQHIFNGHFDISQQCALISVEEIIEAITFNTYDQEAFNEENDFWHSVKKEIENL